MGFRPKLGADGKPIESVDELPPWKHLIPLGLQHVLVMYAGAIAVPLIVGRALKLAPEQVALLISADLFCCGLATLIQAFGVTQWFGVKLPVMMGVTFAAVSPMVAIASSNPGTDGARLLFGSIIGAGIISIVIAPGVSRMLRFFPPVVTGTIIAVIGIDLMRVGINWIFGVPVGPTAPLIVQPEHSEWLSTLRSAAATGASRSRVVSMHILRNSLIPVVTFLGADLGALLGGAVVTEGIFNIHGVGGALYQAVTRQEAPTVVGIVTVLVLVYLVANLVVDLLYAALDPRIRYG